MVGGVDRLSLDSIRCLSSLQVDNEDQRVGIVAMPSYTLKHVVEQVHCGAAHVDGDGVEEEDGVVLGHAELVDHCAVGDVETFANLLRSVEGPVGISVQVECLPNTRNTLDVVVEHVVGAGLRGPVSSAHRGVQLGVVVADPLQGAWAEYVDFWKICGSNEL